MNGDNSKRGVAATWFAIGLALAIPAAVMLSFMRGLTSVWRTKWESRTSADDANRYEIGAQSRVSRPMGAAVVATAPPPSAVTEAEASVASTAEDKVVALAITSVTSPIERGAVASVDARATPKAECAIEYRLPGSGNVSNAQGLEAKAADNEGLVSWSWTIGPSTTPGAGAIAVTCGEETTSATIEVT
jgi:micrococcal nuclease